VARPKHFAERVEVSLTAAQAAALYTHARSLGCSLADLLRQLVDDHVPGLTQPIAKPKRSRRAS
jgi:hypothetical protein